MSGKSHNDDGAKIMRRWDYFMASRLLRISAAADIKGGRQGRKTISMALGEWLMF
jgi:hypothetical protein